MKFTATPGKRILIYAALHLALLITFFGWQFSMARHADSWTYLVTGLLLLAMVASSAAYYVRYYKVTADELVVRKVFSKFRVEKRDIREAEILPKGALGFSWMVLGSGNIVAMTGDYSNSRFGTMTWFRTRTDKIVMITTSSNRKIVLSPDEPEKFVASLQP